LHLTDSPLAVSFAEIISQQIYSTEVSKILINDLMKFLKQDEKLVNLPDLLVAYISDTIKPWLHQLNAELGVCIRLWIFTLSRSFGQNFD